MLVLSRGNTTPLFRTLSVNLPLKAFRQFTSTALAVIALPQHVILGSVC